MIGRQICAFYENVLDLAHSQHVLADLPKESKSAEVLLR